MVECQGSCRAGQIDADFDLLIDGTQAPGLLVGGECERARRARGDMIDPPDILGNGMHDTLRRGTYQAPVVAAAHEPVAEVWGEAQADVLVRMNMKRSGRRLLLYGQLGSSAGVDLYARAGRPPSVGQHERAIAQREAKGLRSFIPRQSHH